MDSDRPFSQACENNKNAILSVLTGVLADTKHVLEVGSGSGQHAVYFAKALPHLIWQTADRPEYHDGINAWLNWADLENVKSPLTLDVNQPFPVDHIEAVFSANTLHIMSWHEVQLFFSEIGSRLNAEGLLCVYGPFNYDGEYTSDSNARFDQWLKQRDPQSGIRDISDVDNLAKEQGLLLKADHAMPANNRLLVWHKL